MNASQVDDVNWQPSAGGSSRFAFVGDCKIVEVWSLFLVERVVDGMPTGQHLPGSPFSTLDRALAAIDTEDGSR
jgi:hypothetical protein